MASSQKMKQRAYVIRQEESPDQQATTQVRMIGKHVRLGRQQESISG